MGFMEFFSDLRGLRCLIFLMIFFIGPNAIAIPIYSCGQIAQEGTYELQNNIPNITNACFISTVGSVTIDGKGFTISASSGGINSNAIKIAPFGVDQIRNVVIKNINISNFATGIEFYNVLDSNIENIVVSNADSGVMMSFGQNNTVKNVKVINGNSNGVKLTGANNNIFTDINLYNSGFGESAIMLLDSSNNIFTNTTIDNPLGTVNWGVDFGLDISSSVSSTSNYNQFTNTTIKNTPTYIVAGNLALGDTLNNTTYATDYGSIKYSGNYLVGGNAEINNSKLNVTQNSAVINPAGDTLLETSASVILKNITGIANPTAYKNGSICTSCSNFTSLGGNAYSFNVAGSGEYSIGENILPLCIAPPSGGSVSYSLPVNCVFYGSLGNASSLVKVSGKSKVSIINAADLTSFYSRAFSTSDYYFDDLDRVWANGDFYAIPIGNDTNLEIVSPVSDYNFYISVPAGNTNPMILSINPIVEGYHPADADKNWMITQKEFMDYGHCFMHPQDCLLPLTVTNHYFFNAGTIYKYALNKQYSYVPGKFCPPDLPGDCWTFVVN